MDNRDRDWTALLINAMSQNTAQTQAHTPRQVLLSFLEVLDSLDRLVAIADSAEECSRSGAPDQSNPLQALSKLLNLFRRSKGDFSVAERSGTQMSMWSDHLQALRQQLLAAFECAGVTFFDCIGQPFDPERHEAVKAVQQYGVDDYTVIEAISRGCEWRGQVLRPARVVVARHTD